MPPHPVADASESPEPAWQPIDSAPKDGRIVDLTWMGADGPEEIWPMQWDSRASNPLAQQGTGIWVLRNAVTGQTEMTWTEKDPEVGPTHWRPRVGLH